MQDYFSYPGVLVLCFLFWFLGVGWETVAFRLTIGNRQTLHDAVYSKQAEAAAYSGAAVAPSEHTGSTDVSFSVHVYVCLFFLHSLAAPQRFCGWQT